MFYWLEYRDTLGKVVSTHGIRGAEVTTVNVVISRYGLDAKVCEAQDKMQGEVGAGRASWGITRQRAAYICNHLAKELFHLLLDQKGL